MPKFTIHYDQVRSYSIVIEADNKKRAMDKFDKMYEKDSVDVTDRSSFDQSHLEEVQVL